MARKKKLNLGMILAIAAGGLYLLRQYKARQAVAAIGATAPQATISSSIQQAVTSGPN